MKKLLQILDDNLLKWGVALTSAFIVLYPKLPTIHINHTWVYIRLEDFLISCLIGWWLIQVIRKKVSLPFPVARSILLYWLCGLVSLLISFIFIAPHLANFFPSIAILSYVRRIEYMLLFFVGFAAIRTQNDLKGFIRALLVTAGIIELYAFGQRWYLLLWQAFPHFFEKYPFCFPSYQTGNEEFAKGLPLCLPFDARITSTFGGHYDLAAYMVFILPVLFGVVLAYRNVAAKILAGMIWLGGLIALIFTASRISFVAYLVGIIFTLIFIKQKKLILPVVVISIGVLFLFNGSTARRFLETFRLTSVVTDSQGQVIGLAPNSLSADLRSKIAKNPDSTLVVAAPPPTTSLPAGSGLFTLPQLNAPTKTQVAFVEQSIPKDKLKQLKLANGGIELSTVSGSFLIQKALVYDISFTTRFQSEWPTAWNAFLTNPLSGAGYSSITLATDGDYFRFLGETGLIGLISFMLIFMCLGILLFSGRETLTIPIEKMFVFGLAGGAIGIFFNALFIDVFEASKVAEPMWLFLGVGTGILASHFKDTVAYLPALRKIFSSNIFIALYLVIGLGIVFFPAISGYFVADDFTWLKWAANANISDIPKYFINAEGFFYRPLDKTLMMMMYTFFSFVRPEGYHLVIQALHFFIAFAVYLILRRMSRSKLLAFVGALLFLFHPAHAENMYWIATISTTLSTLFIVYAVFWWFLFRERNSLAMYILCLIAYILALFSYEMSVILPLLLIATDLFLGVSLKVKKSLLAYLPMIAVTVGYLGLRNSAHAVQPGGDYSINWSHFLPNFIGNLLGYIGYFLSGEKMLPFYTWLRSTAKVHAIFITIPLLLFVLVGTLFVIKGVHGIRIAHNQWIYGLLFGLIALLPFIGLGNITGRYVYLASVGWTIASVVLFSWFYSLLGSLLGSVLRARIVFCSVCAVILLIGAISIRGEYPQWERAGEITSMTLQLLHEEYPKLDPGYRLIFINVPIKYQNAWVFPVGLSDGIWFIYRDDTIKVYSVKDLDTARALINNNRFQVTRFMFDKYGNLSQVD